MEDILIKGVSFHNAGRLNEAEACYQKVLKIQPDNFIALGNYGTILYGNGKIVEAINCFKKAITAKPDYADAQLNLGTILKGQERWEEAIECYKQVISITPNNIQAHFDIATIFTKLKNIQDAIIYYEKIIAIKPDHVDAYNNLGNLLHEEGKLDSAITCFNKALACLPNNVIVYNNLGNVYKDQGNFDLSIANFQKAININPNIFELHINLGVVYTIIGKLDEAINCYKKAIAIKPDSAELYNNLGAALKDQGKIDEAILYFKKALTIKPDYPVAHSNMIFTTDLLTISNTAYLQKIRKEWAKKYADPLQNYFTTFKNSKNPTRKLRIGYVGSDFRHHSAASIFGPVIFNHNPDKFEIYCYVGNLDHDDVTKKFKIHSFRWLQTTHLNDTELAEQIYKDGIDILVDLAGHSRGNRLLSFAHKPAPIQITAWGYPHGTGMKAMDYLFSDPVFIPKFEIEIYSEHIIDLPCMLHLNSDSNIQFPEINLLPATKTKNVTFGAFNRLEKNSDAVYASWAKILQRVPNSQILFKAPQLDSPSQTEALKTKFNKKGIPNERIMTMGRSSPTKHLLAYNLIDIMLDPFPHNGGVTTLESLKMGVPVLTCLNKSTCRVSGGILQAIDLHDWCATDEADYIERAQRFAKDIDSLAILRSQLRKRFESSVLGNSPLYTAQVEKIYRKLWHNWCKSEN
ncbi:MAG: tetratricopeptide repeat protein [Magnetococcales bacterium]|nr:tetratricopeptide repeat protein [Magnetococcales bacterium]